jgi:hypothetical protein
MKKRLLAFCLALIPALTSSLFAAPANDNIASAAPATLGIFPAENDTATNENGELSHAGFGGTANHSVWFKYTATFDGFVQLDTAGSTQADTIAAVYLGSTYGKQTLVARNDTSGASQQAKLTFRVATGTTYYIALDNRGDGGLFKVELTPTIRFANVRYEGAILPPNNLASFPADYGKLSVNVTAKGSFTGTLLTGKARYPFKGSFPANGGGLIQIPRPGLLDATVILAPVPGADKSLTSTLGAIVRLTDGDFNTELYSVPKYSKTNPCPRTGRYNFAWNTLASGLGFGFGTLTVAESGAARAVGSLGDGTPFSFSSTITNNAHLDDINNIALGGRISYHTPLSGGGQLTGTFDVGLQLLNSACHWVSPGSPKRKSFHQNGYEMDLIGGGSLYNKQAANVRLAPVFDGPNGVGIVQFQPVSEAARQESMNLSTANKVTVTTQAGTRNFQITVDPATGFLKGSYVDIATNEPRTITGIYVPGNLAPKFYGIVNSKLGCGPMNMQP